MTPVLQRMSDQKSQPPMPSAVGVPLDNNNGDASRASRPDSRASSGYGGQQIELNLQEFGGSKPVVEDGAVVYTNTGASNTNGGGEDEPTKKEGMPRKKKCIIALLALLVVGGAVGAALGMTLGSNTDDSSDQNKNLGTGSDEDAGNKDDGDRENDIPPVDAPVSSPETTSTAMPETETRPPSPAIVPDSKEETALKILQSNIPSESYTSVSDPYMSTPQNSALDWVLYDDTFSYQWDSMATNPYVNNTDTIDFLQRYTLATFYTVLGGEEWTDSKNWMSGEDVCGWFGVTCLFEEGEDDTVGGGNSEAAAAAKEGRQLQTTSYSNSITQLSLKENNLDGWLPADISALTSLTKLELHRNKLRGQIPPHIYNIVSLKTLFFDDNRLEGPISPKIGQLVNLEKLTLNVNKLEGGVPVEIGGLVKLSM